MQLFCFVLFCCGTCVILSELRSFFSCQPFITHSGCCCFLLFFFAVSLHINQEDDGECVHGLLPAAMQPPGCLVKVRAWFPQTLLSRDAWLPHCQLPWTPAVKRTGHWYTHTNTRVRARTASLLHTKAAFRLLISGEARRGSLTWLYASHRIKTGIKMIRETAGGQIIRKRPRLNDGLRCRWEL